MIIRKMPQISFLLLFSFVASFFVFPTLLFAQATTTPLSNTTFSTGDDYCANLNLNPGLGAAVAGSAPASSADAIKQVICAPSPRIKIPGVDFSDAATVAKLANKNEDGQVTHLNIPFFGEYLSGIYQYAVVATSVLAVIVIIVAGIQWTAAGANSDIINSAKTHIVQAISGLVIAVSSYAILWIINPSLVKFEYLSVEFLYPDTIEYESVIDDSHGGPSDSSSPTAGPAASGVTTPANLGRRNPIPFLIGDAPASMPKCSSQLAVYTAEKLMDLSICVGACHCAYTASHFLNYIGCEIQFSGSAPRLRENAKNGGWTELTYAAAYSSRGNSFVGAPVGLLYQSGHVGVSLGNGKYFDSGTSGRFTTRVLRDSNCPDKFGDINPNDPNANCAACSRIPTEGPATGRFAANGTTNRFGLTGRNGGSTCESTQVWSMKDMYRPRTRSGWSHLLHP